MLVKMGMIGEILLLILESLALCVLAFVMMLDVYLLPV